MSNKLVSKSDVEQMPNWFKTFLFQVVKRSAMILIKWIDEVQEAERQSRIKVVK